MRTKLQLALFETDSPQYRVAQHAGLSETRLSRIAAGRIKPTETERRQIAAALCRQEAELFEDESSSGSGLE